MTENERPDAATDIKGVIRSTFAGITDMADVETLLEIIACNPGMDLANDLLIWRQKKDAHTVASRRFWEEKGLKTDDFPITILLPIIRYIPGSAVIMRGEDGSLLTDRYGELLYEREPAYSRKYLPVSVYDGPDTVEGCDEAPVNDLADRIKSQGIRIIDQPFEELPGNHTGYAGADEIYLPEEWKNMPGLYNAKLTEHYVRLEMGLLAKDEDPLTLNDKSQLFESVLRTLVRRRILGIPIRETIRVLTGPLTGVPKENRWVIMSYSVWYYRRILEDLTGVFLSFTETSILNGLLDSGNKADLFRTLDHARASAKEDPELIYNMNSLEKKILNARKGFLEELYEKRLKDKVLKTMPRIAVPQNW